MSAAPITMRAEKMHREHLTRSTSSIERWRMSKATIEAILAEHDTVPLGGGPATLFGSPITIDEGMALGVLDLVPEGSMPYFPEATS